MQEVGSHPPLYLGHTPDEYERREENRETNPEYERAHTDSESNHNQ